MISVIAVNPSANALRAFANQIWDPTDELLLVIEPGSGGDVALRAMNATDLFGSLRVTLYDRPLEADWIWDSYTAPIRAAETGWVWALSPGSVPAPRAMEALRASIDSDSGAKIHLFRAYGPGNVLLPPYGGNPELLGPKTITGSCALVPKGLAQLGSFAPNEWGDASWLAEMARLHVSGDEALIWHNTLIALRDLDRPIREQRKELHSVTPHWYFYPAFDSSPEPVASIVTGDTSLGVITIQQDWRGRGIFLSLVQFLLEARAGEAVTVSVINATEGERVALEGAGFSLREDTASHPGLCAQWQ